MKLVDENAEYGTIDTETMNSVATPSKNNNKTTPMSTAQNNRGDRRGESNESPEIPDRRITSEIPGLPLGSGETHVHVI